MQAVALAEGPVRDPFVSEDPIGFLGGFNFYTYVGNRPSVFVDPFGLVLVPPPGLANKLIGRLGEVVAGVATVGPWDAWTARGIGNGAWSTSDRTNLPGGGNGPRDALRHCLVSCRLASEINQDDAEDAANAHEFGNILEGKQTEAELQMDQSNNQKGRSCAARGAGGPGGPSCLQACMQELRGGNLSGPGGTPTTFPGWGKW